MSIISYFISGGGGGSRIRVLNNFYFKSFTSLFSFFHPLTKIVGYNLTLTNLLH